MTGQQQACGVCVSISNQSIDCHSWLGSLASVARYYQGLSHCKTWHFWRIGFFHTWEFGLPWTELGMKRHLLCPGPNLHCSARPPVLVFSLMGTCLTAQPMLGLGPEVLFREKRVDGPLECLRSKSLGFTDASPSLAHP